MDQDFDHNDDQNIPQPKREIAEEVFWDGPEYEFAEKSSEWFWILGTIAVLMMIISVIVGDIMLALIILLASFILGTHAIRPPRTITYGLTKQGIKHGETTFRWDSIRSFWVNPERHSLVIESGRLVKPHIYIPLGEAGAEQVRQLLLPILKEQEYHGSFGDFVTEFFGF